MTELSHQSDVGVHHGRWTNDRADSVKLWCPTCGWRKNGTQGTIVAAGVKHAKTTGHRVQLYRRQWKSITPDREAQHA